MNYLFLVWKIWSSIPATISVIFFNMLIFYCFLNPRWKWWIYPLLIIMTLFISPAMYLFNKSLFKQDFSSSLFLTLLGYWGIILVLITFRDHFTKSISVTFTICILNRIFTFWSYILYIPLNKLSGGYIDISLAAFLVITVMYTILLLLYWFVLRKKVQVLIHPGLSRHSWASLAGIAVFAKLIIDYCADHLFSLSPYTDSNIILTMTALCIFVIAVLALYLYNTQITMKHLELKVASDRLIFEKTAQQQYYETQLHNQEEVNRIKHDMKGHLNIIYGLLKEDKKDEVLSYLTNFHNYTNNHEQKLYSADPYLNAVVSNYASLFSDNNILFEFDIQIGKIEFHNVEMCVILNNALQNALEASLKLDSNQRFVKLQGKIKQSHLLFRISNRFDGMLNIGNDLPLSTKEGTGHGYGMSSIRNSAESVGGFIKFEIEGDIFTLDVVI